MPTPIPTPASGQKLSEQQVLTALAGSERVVAIRPTAADPTKFDNVGLPVTLLALAPVHATLDDLGGPSGQAAQKKATLGTLYAITGDWNAAADASATVLVQGLAGGVFAPTGFAVEGSTGQAVVVDVAAGAFAPLAAGLAVDNPLVTRADLIVQEDARANILISSRQGAFSTIDSTGDSNLVITSNDSHISGTGSDNTIVGGNGNQILDGTGNYIGASAGSSVEGGNGNAIVGGVAVTIPATCLNVLALNCLHFTVPDGAHNVTYIGNQLAGSGPATLVDADLTTNPTSTTHAASVKAVNDAFTALVAGAPAALDTLKEIANQLASDEQGAAAILATQQQHTQQIGANQAGVTQNATNIALLVARIFGQNRGPWKASTTYAQYDFVTYQGTQYYANQGFTSGSTFNAANWTAGNYQSGLWSLLAPAEKQNLVAGLQSNCSYGADMTYTLYAHNHYFNTYGTGHAYNTYGHTHGFNQYGNNHQNNRYGARHTNNTYGDNHQNNTYGDGIQSIAVGDTCSYLRVGSGCSYVSIGAGCVDVEVLATNGTSQNPVVIPAGTSHAKYVNGVLQTTSTSSTPTASSSGIDYANPITLTAAATLTANKAYHVTGSSYQLTLPDAASAGGGGIFIEVAPDATGLFQLTNGSSLALYASETMLLRATPSGWKQAGGQLQPMTAEIQTNLNQQDGVTTAGGGQAVTVPFSVVAEAIGPAGLVNANSVVVQRAGRAALRASVSLKNVQAGGGYALYLSKNGQFIASANLPVGDFGGGGLLAIGEVTKTAKFAAGDVLTVSIYTSLPGNYRGQYDGSQAIFSYTEIV